MTDQQYQAQIEKINQVTQNAKRMIFVTFQKEGIHCFPAAADEQSLADVKFLSYPHRHIFHFKVQIEVYHDDRDIEFIQFKRWLENLFSNHIMELDYKSCEMIANDLYAQIAMNYYGRDVIINVSEDNENGVTVEYLF